MAKESKKTEQTEVIASAEHPQTKNRMNGWAIAGISAAGALLIAGSAAAGAVVGVTAVGLELRDGDHHYAEMHDRDDDRWERDDHDEREFGDREHQGERDRDGFQRQQGPGMPNQQDAPQQQLTPEPQADVTS